MIFGGRARFTDADPATRAQLLHQMMTRRLPQLADARVTHSWTGFVAFTIDYLPHAGRLNGMLYCAGCNGSGVAIMSYLGSLLARRVIEGEEPKSAFFDRPLPRVPVPFYRGNPWFQSIAAIPGSSRRSALGTTCATASTGGLPSVLNQKFA